MARDRDTEAAMIKQAIEDVTLAPKEIAESLGISDSLLRKYRDGSRPIPPEFRYKLAAVLAEHQATLGVWVRKLSR